MQITDYVKPELIGVLYFVGVIGLKQAMRR